MLADEIVTDSIAIEARGKSNVLRIKPSSYRPFNNPSSVRARLLGTRSQSGGFRLDKKGLCIADEDSFDEFKWFEIDFNTEEGIFLLPPTLIRWRADWSRNVLFQERLLLHLKGQTEGEETG
jgi:hypothetical protein